MASLRDAPLPGARRSRHYADRVRIYSIALFSGAFGAFALVTAATAYRGAGAAAVALVGTMSLSLAVRCCVLGIWVRSTDVVVRSIFRTKVFAASEILRFATSSRRDGEEFPAIALHDGTVVEIPMLRAGYLYEFKSSDQMWGKTPEELNGWLEDSRR